MKRGKDEEKMMGPMFPRLHVNDTEKGGPRAPPRNKMALYEQLSIPSQRFSHVVLPCSPKNRVAGMMPQLSQGGGDDRGMFFARQVLPRLPSEKQYDQYSELSTPLVQVEQRKKLDEDDYRVPIFIDSIPTEFDKCSRDVNRESFSPPNLHSSSKFQKAKDRWMIEHNMNQEGKNKKGENSNKFMAGRKQSASSQSNERGDDRANSNRLRTDDSGQPELSQPTSDRHSAALLGEDTAVAAKRKSSNSLRALPSEDTNFVHDLSNDTGSHEDGSCGPLPKGNLERGDSVSETSVLDTVSSLNMTPDDVVGIIGQKHFWKARRAILNQQRIFAVQVFELHRLIEVQKMIAASPHLLLEDSAYFTKPVMALSGKKRQLDHAVKSISTVPNEKGDSEYPSHKKKSTANTTVEKASFSSAQNGVVPSSCGSPAASVTGSEHKPCLTQSQAHQWLIPVMSPSEGLVYKPYPGPGVVGQACGGYAPPGSNPIMPNFCTPAYGVPAPPAPYPFPYGYFPPYGLPIMTTTAFSGSSVEKMSLPQGMSTMPAQKKGTVPDTWNSCAAEEVEVQASSASSQSERRQESMVMEGRSVLRLLPTSPVIEASNSCPPEPERLNRVIKVVPHNGLSASESAARIFRSIQEERKQYESV